MQIANMNTGFIEIPNKISLNIYAQGCKKNCAGCHNKEIQSFDGGINIPLDTMESMLTGYPMAEWVCWLGGDGTYQPEAFVEFNKMFQRHGLKVCLYTGRLFEEVWSLLDNVNLVIDGEWQGIPVTEEGTNQKIYVREKNMFKPVAWAELCAILNEQTKKEDK